jgi:RNA polymerase sigma factor (sigma-70 family)
MIKELTTFTLAQRCLEGDQEAIATLQADYGPALIAYLIRSGAMESDAREIVGSLWADCTVGDSGRPPRFEKYHGKCALLTWLKTVALNALIDTKRRQARFRAIEATVVATGGTAGGCAALIPSSLGEPATEAPLLEIMKTALLAAMERCPAQSYVMLQLVHLNGLTQREVAQAWGWHESKVSRALDAAAERIATETLRAVQEADPWLELGWDDFVELCQCHELPLLA